MTAASRWFALVLVLAPVAAFADQRSDADAAFKRGREAFKAEKYAEACSAFEDSFALDPQLGTKFNLAQCNEKIGKLATAMAMYRELLAVDDNTVRKGLTTDALTSLESRVPKIRIVVAKPPPNLVVLLEDEAGKRKPIDPAQVAQVDAGTYHVIANGSGVKEWTSPAMPAAEGQTTQVVVLFSPAAGPARTERHSIWDPEARPRLKAAAIIAGGGAVLITGLVFGYQAFHYHDQAVDACGGGTMCPTPADLDKADSLASKSHTRGTISSVLCALGVAAIGTGSVMYLLASHSEPAISVHAGESSAGVTFTTGF